MKRSSRRMFLRSATGAALGLPFMRSLLPKNANAAQDGPLRFIAIQSQSGQMVGDYWPTATPSGYQLRDAAYGGDRTDGTTMLTEPIAGSHGFSAPLADFAGQDLSRVLTSELEPFLDKLSLVRGLDLLAGTSHGTGMLLGNYANSTAADEYESRGLPQIPTIDQVLAYSPAFYPETPSARSLVLATGSPSSISDTDYGVSGGPVESLPAYLEPQHVWEDLFSDFVDPDMPMEHPNRRLLNAVYDDYARVNQHPRLSTDDRAALERHMEFLADIERQLSTSVAQGCARPESPAFFDMGYPWQEVSSVSDFEQVVGLLVDIAAAALRCDLTRVVTFRAQMGITDASGTKVTSYHSSDDVAGDWHDFAHDAVTDDSDHAHIVALNRWVGQAIFRRFLEQLDVEESDGNSFLDNSLVYWGAELSMDHYVLGMPTLLAGGAGGRLQTGRYYDYTNLDGDYANPILPWGVLIPGLPHQRLLVTILQAMGLSPSDYERDGLIGYGHSAAFSTPWNFPDDAYALDQLGQPLPGLFLG